jgi:CheY-like chemotaxis protein
MDFNLPDVDGRTVVLLLRQQLGGPAAPPIVAVTAQTGDKERMLAKSYGCAAFVAKPFVPEDLLNLVIQLVKREKS